MKETFVQPKIEKELPETRVEQLFGNLKEQYIDQVRTLNEAGVLELLPDSGELGIIDIDGKEWPVPTYDEIVARIEQKDGIERMKENGFDTLLLVPFGMSLIQLMKRTEAVLNKNHAVIPNEIIMKFHSPLSLENVTQNLNDYQYYSHGQTSSDVDKFKTKQTLLKEGSNGWNIQLLSIQEFEQGQVSNPVTIEDVMTYTLWVEKNQLNEDVLWGGTADGVIIEPLKKSKLRNTLVISMGFGYDNGFMTITTSTQRKNRLQQRPPFRPFQVIQV